MKRTISLVLALSLMVGLFVVPASAASNIVSAKDVLYDTASVDQWTAYFTGTIFGDLANSYKWSMLNDPIKVAGVGSLASLSSLESARSRFLAKHKSICTNPVYIIGNLLVDGHAVNPIISYDESLGVYRLKDSRSGLWLVSNSGTFPYYAPSVTDPTTGTTTPDPDLGGKWILESKVNWQKVNILSEYNLYSMGSQLKASVPDNDIGTYDRKYYYLGGKWADDSSGDHYVYCDGSGRPYVARVAENEWSQNNTNNYYTEVTEEGDTIYNTGDTIETQLIDNSTNTVVLPNGDINFIENLVYDESTKTYYVDAHQEYDLTSNTYITNHYKFEYHINYTSVTYIGATEEYTETYDCYYQLPDGRSSADLTAEELQVLNTQIDVLPYNRSADDTSIRALYHFDGDCLDSSYWSHLGSLSWTTGASITYMDANKFNGALYLDENAHDFTITLPSTLGVKDWTIQWRYYQSHTLTPVRDSYFAIGGLPIMRFDGASIYTPVKSTSILGETTSFEAVAPVSVGSWQEIAVVRKDGSITYFLNGVPIGSAFDAGAMAKTLHFVFGADQQTFKYFDELRVVSAALYDAEKGYVPSSVPHDTNLALVLPDEDLPVADEYWDIKSSGENLLSEYGMDWMTELVTSGNPYISSSTSTTSSREYPAWCYNAKYTDFVVDGGLSLTSITSTYDLFYESTTTGVPYYGFYTLLYKRTGNSSNELTTEVCLPVGDYVFSVVTEDGTITSLPFTRKNATATDYVVEGGGYRLAMLGDKYTDSYDNVEYHQYLAIQPLQYDVPAPRIVYMELIKGTETDLSAEFISSIVVMKKEDLNTPSLAVRTDTTITGYQIGGVRPSLPSKGLVWALVESGRITSLQIYNGQAWVAVDGRIWTGSRWVPYYAYDVLLLKDLLDIVESDPTIDPIYTEEGFWTWLQNAWGDMLDKLDQIIDGLGGSGGSGGSGSGSEDTRGFWDKIADAFTNGLAALIEAAFDMISTILKTLLSLVTDMLSFIFGFVTESVLGAIGDFFSIFTDGSLLDGFQQTDENGNTTTQLPDGVGTVFTEMSGFFTALPPELSSVLIFGIGLLFFIAVIKLV